MVIEVIVPYTSQIKVRTFYRTQTMASLENLTLESKEVNDEDDVVNPWNVCGKSKSGIDYDKLISKH